MKRTFAFLLCVLLTCSLFLVGCEKENDVADKKPVIYLYPEVETDVNVKLDYAGRLTCTYPEYKNGWSVTARPDGRLTDADGREYYCLFWEGIADEPYEMVDGFVVAGNETAEFLREKLLYLGLTEVEANEFIIYWLPQMQGNAYNCIRFAGDDYTENAKLTIDPAPDTLIRVFMVWQGIDAPIEIEEQILTVGPERKGFVAVEWGGCELVG